ncbi:hypothetical protein LCI18_000171 [Fusarium solani-melongenae]|uniref:Uncharacterized protein n=1 Tax=Fusarium solani subsp. cucurbitae TaxID=2747967 RepID=A0ACD3YK52_FUSSC|nr:hypothetical protein LCI18_000171 [Fusarium solani-melongenae]
MLRCHRRHDRWNVIAVPVEKRSGRWYRTSLETTTCPEDQWPDNISDKLLSQNPYVQSADIHYAIKPLPLGLRVTEVFPDDSWEEPRTTQTRIKGRGSAGSPTVTFVRLKDGAESDGVKCDYVLKLDVDGPLEQTPTCQLGILPAFGGYGVAITITGESSALAVKLTTRLLHGKEANVVDLFVDEARRKCDASCSRALPELPSKTEKDKDERLDRERQDGEE